MVTELAEHEAESAAKSPARAHRPRRARLVLVAVGVVVALIAGAIGMRRWLTAPAHEITPDEAVEHFREQTPSSTTRSLTMPESGVYVYDTAGQESIDALGGDTHTYPAETTMTVTAEGCGFRASWTPVTGRTESSLVCVEGGGLAIRDSTTAHEFFRQSDEVTFVCDSGAWWLPPVGTTDWTTTCRTADRVSTRAGRLIGTETLTIGGEPRPSIHVRYDDVLSAGSSGTTTSDLWLDPGTGLVMKQHNEADTKNESVIGHVVFRERLDLALRSFTPRR